MFAWWNSKQLKEKIEENMAIIAKEKEERGAANGKSEKS